MSVTVAGQRQLIEPTVLGGCQDPSCVTFAATGSAAGLLLVATYFPGGIHRDLTGRATNGIRVCAACDERALRTWLEDDR